MYTSYYRYIRRYDGMSITLQVQGPSETWSFTSLSTGFASPDPVKWGPWPAGIIKSFLFLSQGVIWEGMWIHRERTHTWIFQLLSRISAFWLACMDEQAEILHSWKIQIYPITGQELTMNCPHEILEWMRLTNTTNMRCSGSGLL